MNLQPITTTNDIVKGDKLLITGDTLKNDQVTVEMVKFSSDGVEVIFDLKQNRFFNLGMFLEGKSWVKQCKKIV